MNENELCSIGIKSCLDPEFPLEELLAVIDMLCFMVWLRYWPQIVNILLIFVWSGILLCQQCCVWHLPNDWPLQSKSL